MRPILHKYAYLKEWILAIALVSSTISSALSSISVGIPLLLALLYSLKPLQNTGKQTWIIFCIAALFIPGALWNGDIALLGFGLSSICILIGVFFLQSTLSFVLFFRALLYSSGILCMCLVAAAGLQVLDSGNIDLMLYHSLSAPIWANAIYLSAFLFGVLYFSLVHAVYSSRKDLFFLSIVFLTLLLLQSRVFIVLSLASTAYGYFSGRIFSPISLPKLALIVASIGLIAFAALIPRVMEIANQESYKYDTQTVIREDVEYNGLELRVLFLGFTKNIMKQSSINEWLFGRGRKQTTEQLNASILSKGMYTGAEGATGFLNYNTHNQFAQTLLHQGILGVICLLLTLYLVASSGHFYHIAILVGFIFAFLTEVHLERHLGVVIFSYWLSFSAFSKPTNA